MFKGFCRLVHLNFRMFQKRLDDGRRVILFLQVVHHILTALREIFSHIFTDIGQVAHKAPAAIREFAVFVKLKSVALAPQVGIISGHFAAHQILRLFPKGAGHFFAAELF